MLLRDVGVEVIDIQVGFKVFVCISSFSLVGFFFHKTILLLVQKYYIVGFAFHSYNNFYNII